jgi:hypothetical protein
VTGRPVVTAYCDGRGGRSHTLAELLALPDGLHICIRRCAVGHAKGTRVVNRRGGPLDAPLLDEDGEPSMTYLAMCAHGVHAVNARDLARAKDAGTKVITLAPVLL